MRFHRKERREKKRASYISYANFACIERRSLARSHARVITERAVALNNFLVQSANDSTDYLYIRSVPDRCVNDSQQWPIKTLSRRYFVKKTRRYETHRRRSTRLASRRRVYIFVFSYRIATNSFHRSYHAGYVM